MLEKEPNSEDDENVHPKERIISTPVTRESFLEWKAKFESENKKEIVITEVLQKLTGRAFFEKHKAEAMTMGDEEEDAEDEK